MPTFDSFAKEEQRLRQQRSRTAGRPEAAQIQVRDGGMVGRSVAVRHHPHLLAGVHVEGGDAAVGRLEERQPPRPADPLAGALDVGQVGPVGVALEDVGDERRGDRRDVEVVGLRIRTPRPGCPRRPASPGSWIVPWLSLGPAPRTDGGVNIGPMV